VSSDAHSSVKQDLDAKSLHEPPDELDGVETVIGAKSAFIPVIEAVVNANATALSEFFVGFLDPDEFFR
jgi:hypothetical protein